MTATLTDPRARRLHQLARTLTAIPQTSDHGAVKAEALKAEVVCGEIEGRCRCDLPPHDDDTHECSCGGSWRNNPDGTLTPLKVPGTGQPWPKPWPKPWPESGLWGLL